MSVGENLSEPPEEQSEGIADRLKVLDGLKANSQRIRMAVEIASLAPTREVMAEMQSAINEARGFFDFLHDEQFFRSSQNDMLVSFAVTALVENVKVAYDCTGSLSDSYPPGGVIIHNPADGVSSPIRLEVAVEDGPPEAYRSETDEAIDRVANLMVTGDNRDAVGLSTALQAMGKDAYERLINGLSVNPVTTEFFKKEARKKKIIDNAKMMGLVAVPAFLASAAGTASVIELMIRH